MQSFESVETGIIQSQNERQLKELREKVAGFNTENEMIFFTRNWSNGDGTARDDSADLLQEPQAARRQLQRPKGVKVGRNASCPCGSGKKYKKCCIDLEFTSNPLDTLNADDPLNKTDEWIDAGYYYLQQNWHFKALACWYNGWQEVGNVLPETIRNPATEECNRFFSSCDFFSNWLIDYQSLLEENMAKDLVVAQNGLIFCREVVARFPDMSCSLSNNFVETTSYLLLTLGKSEQAFSLLEKMIEQYPDVAQGYVVLAALFSLDAVRFNLRPDFHRAQQLLLQAQKNATDCQDWDVEMRLEDLKGWQT